MKRSLGAYLLLAILGTPLFVSPLVFWQSPPKTVDEPAPDPSFSYAQDVAYVWDVDADEAESLNDERPVRFLLTLSEPANAPNTIMDRASNGDVLYARIST